MNEDVCPNKFMVVLSKNRRDSEYVVTPCADAFLRQTVEIKLEVAEEFFGSDHQLPIGPAGDCDVCREADGGRHDEAVVVVGVFADQIDAARRAEDSCLTSEPPFEE